MDGPHLSPGAGGQGKAEDLEDFVGPLDLILHLLSKNKMEIKDIQISLILDQYLQWMTQRKELDLEVASEFVTMASHLVYIKTRMLLSIHDEEALSEMEQLIATLEAHQRNENYLKIKEVVPQLDQQYSVGRDYLTKAPEAIQPDRSLPLCPPQGGPAPGHAGGAGPGSDHKLPPPVSAFQGIVGREPYPGGRKGRGDFPAAGPSGATGSGPCSRAAGAARRWWPPFGGAGAVQGPAAAPGGDGGGLHRHLYRAGEEQREQQNGQRTEAERGEAFWI